MFLTPDAWLAIGAMLLIGTIVILFSIGVGTYVIWSFGTESGGPNASSQNRTAEKPVIREAA